MIEREELPVDVLFVGAGPANLASAIHLARTAKVPDFRHYRASQRLADFTAVFGENFRLFDAQFLQFMKQIR